MSKSPPFEQSSESHQSKAESESESNTSPDAVIAYSQHRFLLEFHELATDVCAGVASCLDVVEKGDAAAGKSSPDPAEVFCAQHAPTLKKLAVTSARLLGEFAIKHIAWINEDAPPPAQVMEEAGNKSPKSKPAT